MIIDMHGHVTAPAELYAYKSVLLASRGHHGKGSPGISDERMHEAGRPPGGTDMRASDGVRC